MKNVRIILTSCFICLAFLLLGSFSQVQAQQTVEQKAKVEQSAAFGEQAKTLTKKVDETSTTKTEKQVFVKSCSAGKYQKLRHTTTNGESLKSNTTKIVAEETKVEKMRKKSTTDNQQIAPEKEIINSEFQSVEKMRKMADITSEDWSPNATSQEVVKEVIAQDEVKVEKMRKKSAVSAATPVSMASAPVNNLAVIQKEKAEKKAVRAQKLYSIPGVSNALNQMKQNDPALYQQFMSDQNEIIRLLNKAELNENHTNALKAFKAKYDLPIVNQ